MKAMHMLLNSWTQVFFSTGGGERRGPITFGELTRMAQDGAIKESDLVWTEGMPDWVRADTLITFACAEVKAPEPSVQKTVLPAKANYFVRHWRGELSLPVSYWLNGILALVIAFSMFIGVGLLIDESAPNAMIFYWSVASVVYVVTCAWQLVGTWRSAIRRNETAPTVWATIAKVMVVLGWISVVNGVTTVMYPGIKESITMRDWLAKNGKWEIEVVRNGREAIITGGIGPGFAQSLQQTLDSQPRLETLHTNLQNGGLIREAINAKQLISARGLRTYVSGSCVSACTLFFAGGKERYALVAARVGFHAPKVPGVTAAQMDYSETRQAYQASGVREDFIDRVLNTPHTTMWYPTSGELESSGFIAAAVTGEQFAIPNVREFVSSGKVAQVLRADPIFAAVSGVEPALFDQIVKETEKGLLAGNTVEEVRAVYLPKLFELRNKYVRVTSDAAVDAFAEEVASQYEFLLTKSPKACVAYFMGRDMASVSAAAAMLPANRRKKEAEVFARIITEANTQRVRTLTDGESTILAQRIMSEVMSDPTAGRDAVLNLARALDGKAHEERAACTGMIAFVRTARRLPEGLSGPMLRTIFGT